MIIPVLLGVLIIVFTLNFFMPGDPVLNQLEKNYTQEQYDKVAHEMGLDRPYIVQLGSYLWGVVSRFDLGTSYSTKQPVVNMIKSRVLVSIKIGLLSTLVTVIIAIPFGIVSSLKQNTLIDYSITTVAVVLASMPGFWLAILLVLVFSLYLKWLPATGLTSWKHYILPVVSNGAMSFAAVTRMTRSSMLEVTRQDYIRTARSKGLTEREIVIGHALKNALIPVVTIVGGMMSFIIGGTVITETIFSIPGMGLLLVTAISQRDYPLILGITVIISIFVCAVNLIVDLAYSFIDPRIKAQFAEETLFGIRPRKRAKTGGTAQ